MVETVVESIRISKETGNRIVLLKERAGDRFASIWIGPFEAESIAMRLQGVETARPLPYDLMTTMLAGLGASVQRVEVTGSENLFTATIFVAVADREMTFDARASDAINLAIRANAPVSVDASLLHALPSAPTPAPVP